MDNCTLINVFTVFMILLTNIECSLNGISKSSHVHDDKSTKKIKGMCFSFTQRF